MDTRRRSVWIGGGALVVLALGFAPAGAAPEEAGPPPAWMFDVRVVRVDLGDGERAEQRPAFQAADRSTSDLAPGALLDALKARGTTRLLLDQRVTTVEGRRCVAQQELHESHLALQFRDASNEQHRPTALRTGAIAQFVPTSEGLGYEVRLEWAGAAQPAGTALHLARWEGTHPLPEGRTLVLHHAQQHAQGAATEVYVLIRAHPAR